MPVQLLDSPDAHLGPGEPRCSERLRETAREAISQYEALQRTIAWEREQPAGDPERIAIEDAAEDEALARL